MLLSKSEILKLKSWPFYLIHLGCIAAFFVPFSWWYVALAVGLYYLRMFGITAGYHRYFAHKSFKTSRAFQFVLAILGTLALQKGVLWWSGHHRTHHRYSGTDQDIHAPEKRGFLWSHIGWILSSQYEDTPYDKIKDFAQYPEIVWLNKNWFIPCLGFGVLLYAVGGFPVFVWGFVVSTVALYHGTFVINSLCHMFGKRRFETIDDSRNSLILALLTLGEGWHNNHHYYQAAARQGMYWWEIDISYAILKVLSWFGIVWDLKTYPNHVYEIAKKPVPKTLKLAKA